ncbi:MAG: SufE family protein [Mariniblastus sp.]|nr:SufE family protein [Mariniblastus sp.]
MTRPNPLSDMANFPPTVDELISEFQEMEDWDERYDYIIDLGRELPALDASLQTEENIVQGCMSTVWLATEVHQNETQNIDIQADSDSIIVKGLIVILLSHYSGKPATEIVQSDALELFEELGLNQHLSPQRRNGLFSMVKRLKQLAADHLVD